MMLKVVDAMKKEIRLYGITVLLCTILLGLIYIQFNAYGNTLLISDSYSQYIALFSKLKQILEQGGSLFYSFEGGLGQSFLGTFFYYLCSPFNLLILFFHDIKDFFLVVIFLKLLCAFIF